MEQEKHAEFLWPTYNKARKDKPKNLFCKKDFLAYL